MEAILMSTLNIPFSIWIRKNILDYPKSAPMGFFQGTQKWVRNSRGKRAISVRVIEVLLYIAQLGQSIYDNIWS